jgi:hypothetical protein
MYSVEFSAADPTDLESFQVPSFVAMPSISRLDADTTLIFLNMNGSYLSEVRDPWFNATTPRQTMGIGADGVVLRFPRYVASQDTNVMACLEQHQLRNPLTGATSRLGGEEVGTSAQALRTGFNENQMAIFNRSFVFSTFGDTECAN